MSPVQEFVSATVGYMEQDLISFETVLEQQLPGGLGVAMITNACAALDLFAWLLYQRADLKVHNDKLFSKILTDNRRFFERDTFVNTEMLYGIIRCGVVHQFYPKGICGITARNNNHPLLANHDGIWVNALGFYRSVLIGLRKVRDYILQLDAEELASIDFRLRLRQQIDLEALGGVDIDPALLPRLD